MGCGGCSVLLKGFLRGCGGGCNSEEDFLKGCVCDCNNEEGFLKGYAYDYNQEEELLTIAAHYWVPAGNLWVESRKGVSAVVREQRGASDLLLANTQALSV
jgi:hypothetical protein